MRGLRLSIQREPNLIMDYAVGVDLKLITMDIHIKAQFYSNLSQPLTKLLYTKLIRTL